MADILEIADPLWDESCRNLKIQRKTEKVLHLRGEDGQGNTAGESDNNRIWDELEDHTHLTYSHDHKEDTGHDCGDDESLHTILADNSGYDYDECTGWTSDKEVRSAKE